jgi:hypothetical protein
MMLFPENDKGSAYGVKRSKRILVRADYICESRCCSLGHERIDDQRKCPCSIDVMGKRVGGFVLPLIYPHALCL